MARGIVEALVAREFSRPFLWGECDCCLAVADVLIALGRPDPAAPYRGAYDSEAGARGVLGGAIGTMMPREAARLGWPEIAPGEALPGDVGIARGVLLIRAARAWAGKGRHGAVIFRRAERAWRTA